MPPSLLHSFTPSGLSGCWPWPCLCHRASSHPVWSVDVLDIHNEHKAFLSSIFTADSVLRGNLMMLSGQACFSWGVLFWGYLSCHWSHNVFVYGKEGDMEMYYFFLQLWMPFSTTFFAFKVFALAPALWDAGEAWIPEAAACGCHVAP